MTKEGIPSLLKLEEINKLIEEMEKLEAAINADKETSKMFNIQQKYPDPRLNELAELRIRLEKIEKE
jgi:hypothetical protein